MASELRSTTLGELTAWASGGTPSKSREDFWNGTIPWISADSMRNLRIRNSDLCITELGLRSGSRLARRGSVLLLVRGSALHNRIPMGVAVREVAFNQDVKAIVPKSKELSDGFLFAWLVGKTNELLEMVEFTGIGAGKLDTKRLQNMPFELPPMSAQNSIAEMFDALQDRISQMETESELLESLARTIFNSWFVDFDPVRAKSEGREPEGMDAGTAALFPGEFEESEIGPIPKGWPMGSILSIANLLSGGTPKTDRADYWSGAIDWASAKDVSQCRDTFLIHTERTITDRGLAESSTKLIPACSTAIVARGATTGRLALLGKEMAMNQTCYALATTVDTPFALYCAIQNMVGQLLQSAHGSVFETITTNTFSSSRVLLPPSPLVKEYENTARHLFLKVLANIELGSTLTSVRDSLLPRLISGKLRVPEAEELVESVL